MLLLAARCVGWVPRPLSLPLASGIALAAVLTLSPGLGSMALALGIWLWLIIGRGRRVAQFALGIGTATALLFLIAAAVTPYLQTTAPYLIHVPFSDTTLAPSARLMIWAEALQNFLQDPLLGRGIGVRPVEVAYLSPYGVLQNLADAQNSFLKVAV